MDETASFDFLNLPENSKVQESLAEYRLLEQLIIQASALGQKVNVCRGDFDAFGADLLLRLGTTTRLVQLKARSGGRNNDGYWDIHQSMLDDPDGVIICARLFLVPTPPSLISQLHISFKLFNKVLYGDKARKRAPIKTHSDKCLVRENECRDITNDLLQLFF